MILYLHSIAKPSLVLKRHSRVGVVNVIVLGVIAVVHELASKKAFSCIFSSSTSTPSHRTPSFTVDGNSLMLHTFHNNEGK